MKSQNLKILALIPARAGSKRVKNKNIRLLGGQPLIAYTIAAAKKSHLINRILVSTNSEEIASVAKKYGAEVPFLRPSALAQDGSTEFEFHQHAVNWLEKNENYIPDLIVNLYPTTPFRKFETIDEAIHIIINHPEADSLRSVRKCSEHPYKMWRVKDEYLEPFVPRNDSASHTLSYQLLPEIYIQNASIYITKPGTLIKFNSTIGDKVLNFIMDDYESIDINSELDFLIAETIIKNKKLSS